MMSGRNSRFPFTASQWQELEHQALIFKYMVSGIPIPPDLLFTIKRSCSESPFSSNNLFSRQPAHSKPRATSSFVVGWNCFQMGLGRKIDPEPGRCRRTDGKKWRCSKEAYPDSKYCERHMHRGKNRSRKPVEVATQTTAAAAAAAPAPDKNNPSALLLSPPSHSLALLSSDHHTHHQNHTYHAQPGNYHTYVNHQFLSSNASSFRPPGIGLPPQDNSTHLILDSGGSCSLPSTDYRNIYGLKEEVDEHAFFSEPSGSMRSLAGTSLDDAWQLTPLRISSFSSSSSPYSSKQRSLSGLQHDYSYLQLQSLSDRDAPKQLKHYEHDNPLGSDIRYPSSSRNEREEEQQKTVHRFFDEWPPGNKDSWLDLDDKSPNNASITTTTTTTTRLSISIPSPSPSPDFPNFNSRTHNDA